MLAAADRAGVSKTVAYDLRKADPSFDAEWDRAVRDGKVEMVEELRTNALERAARGVLEPAGWYKGKPGGAVRKYSDALTMFMLRAHVPETYNFSPGDPTAGGGQVTAEDRAKQIRAYIQALDDSMPRGPEESDGTE